MFIRDLIKSALASAVLIMVLHLLLHFGNQSMFSLASLGFMPGSYVELLLSSSPVGFGDWRTMAVVNLASWICYACIFFLGFRLWRR